MAKRSIAGSRSLVTGASSGIGRQIALELVRGGGDVVIVARRRERLEELADQIAATGRRAVVVTGDIAETSTRQAAVAAAREQLGGLDILVNNAGLSAMGPFADADPARLRRIMDVNYFAPVELTRLALPLLREGKRPIIVNVASIVAHVAVPNLSEYSASKFALRGFSQALRAELFPDIDVLVVNPATTETEIWERMIELNGDTAWRAKRGDTPEFVARKTVKAIRRGRREVFPGVSSKLVAWINRLAPPAVNFMLERRR